jgi:ABC-2 type transport system ATP-binding protein
VAASAVVGIGGGADRPVRSGADSEDLVTVRRLTKRYWNVTALNTVSFGIRRGEIFGYIGPNGAGKTTTIKILVGLMRTYEGSVVLDGHSITAGTAAVRRQIGYLPQRAAFQEWRTVEGALTTFGLLSGLSRVELRDRIPAVLSELGILDARSRRVTELSGGTLQKVGLAQAVLHRPGLLVLDEPMAGLDPVSRFEFKGTLRRLRAAGTTIFFSSHILSDVQDIADRIGVLDRGWLRHVGTFAELQSRLAVPKAIEVELTAPFVEPLDPGLMAGLVRLEVAGPNRLVAHLAADADVDAMVARLIDGVRAAGYAIRSIRPRTPDLEETYVRFLAGAGT